MKLEATGRTGDEGRIVRVTVGSQSETMTLAEWSKIISRPLPAVHIPSESNVTRLRPSEA